MNTTGYVHSISRDIVTGKHLITFLCDKDVLEDFMNEKEILLDIDTKKHREKRSLDANSYFHVLIGKLAEYEHVSKVKMKNEMICQYGKQAFNADGTMVVFKSNLEPSYFESLEALHFSWIRTDYENGNPVYFYKLYDGSHTYDSKEMSTLIEGVVYECKLRDIETLTPVELAKMYASWGRKNV